MLIFQCQPDVMVNCAALSVPRACEVDPPTAMSVNMPSSLVKWLSSFKANGTLLIHLSTDQGRLAESFCIDLYLFTRLFLLIKK